MVRKLSPRGSPDRLKHKYDKLYCLVEASRAAAMYRRVKLTSFRSGTAVLFDVDEALQQLGNWPRSIEETTDWDSMSFEAKREEWKPSFIPGPAIVKIEPMMMFDTSPILTD